MHQMIEFLAKHGCWVLFVAVLGRQACLPAPANLLMLAAGALAGLGRLSLVSIITLSIAAFLLADFTWYRAGRRWGDRTLRFVCELARRPISYPNEIATRFHRYGVKWLLISKFIIGLDAVAAPMCGISQVSVVWFLVADAIGASLWVLSYVAVGYVFSDQLDRIATYIGKMGTLAALVGIAGVCVYLLVKLVHHYRLLCELRLARITSEHLQRPELRALVVNGQTVPIMTEGYELTGKSCGASTAKRTVGGAAVESIIGAGAGPEIITKETR